MPIYSGNCPHCGAHFESRQSKAKFCSPTCGKLYRAIKSGKVPDFIRRHREKASKPLLNAKKIVSNASVGQTRDNAPNTLAIATIQKLQNDRNYYLSVLEQVQANIIPFFTIGGAIVFENMFRGKGKKTNWLSVLAGGYFGYQIDKELHINRAQKAEQTKVQIIEKIREIDKQIRVFQDSEMKRVNEPIKTEKKVSTNGTIHSKELAVLDIPVYELAPPYREFIGNPVENFSMIIYGLPKSGKSNFAVQFSSYLSRSIGETLFVASEEGISRTLQDKIKFNLADNKDLYILPSRKFDEIRKEINNKERNYKFIVIDSINVTDIDVAKLEALKAEHKDKAFISVLQATKKGDFKGSQEYAHNADIIVEVDNGTAKQIGRFNPPSELRIFR